MNIWIVGASSGIGKELALFYINDGHNVAISARDSDALDEIVHNHNNAIALPFDVTNELSCDKAFHNFIDKFASVDLFIYNSGIYEPMSVDNIDTDICKKIVEVNFSAIFHFLPNLIKQMSLQKSGHIALTASVAGYRGLPNSMAYGASKAALINLGEGIYPELRRKNINVSVINPGFVKTRLTDKNDFKMPFIIDAKQAAQIIAKGLEKKKFEIHFPKKFTLFLKFLRILPSFLFLRIVRNIK